MIDDDWRNKTSRLTVAPQTKALCSVHTTTRLSTAVNTAVQNDAHVWCRFPTKPYIYYDKPPRRFAPFRLDFDTPLSSITTLPQSPLSSRPHSCLPSINTPYFTLAFLHFLSPFFAPLVFPPSLPHLPSPSLPLLLYLPIIYPYSCYIALYSTSFSYRLQALLPATPPMTSQRRAVSPAAQISTAPDCR